MTVKILVGLCLSLLFSRDSFALPDLPSFKDCPDIVFNSGFQNDSDPSQGVAGEFPGAFTRTVFSIGQIRTYYISIPPNYDPNIATPLLFSWHGAAGAGTADINAQATRNFWKPYADANNFIIIAQAGTGTTGGGFTIPNDIGILYDILEDMYSSYNIEKKRVYGHGFSSGGHLMHTLMLFYNQGYAAYAISAGTFADAVFEDPDVPANSPILPVFVSVGQSDPMLATIEAERIKFLQAGWLEFENYWLDIFNGGHQLDLNIPSKSWEKLCLFSNHP
jgi:hypothetical protein